MKRVLAGVLALAAAAVLANIRYGPVDLRPNRRGRGHTMTAYTHPNLTCRICGHGGATHVVEGKALAPDATDWDVEVESYYQLSCASTFCLGALAKWADMDDMVHVDTYPLRSRAEAEAISGEQLGEVTR